MGAGTREETILIKGPAGDLECLIWDLPALYLQKKPKVGIVCHPHPLHRGTMNNKVVTTLTRAFQDLNIFSIRFNFRGVGKSEGRYAEGKGEAEDLSSVIQWVKTINPNSKFYLAGFSFGSVIAAIVAQKEHFESLISIAPAIPYFNVVHSAIHCPWLIIHGTKDELIPLATVKEFVDLAKQSHQTLDLIEIPNATHFFHGELITLKNYVKQWLSRLPEI